MSFIAQIHWPDMMAPSAMEEASVPRGPQFPEDDIAADRLRELIDYDSSAGTFTARVALSRAVGVGDEAGIADRTNGYKYVWINGIAYLAARIAWLYVHGSWPTKRLVFQDRDRLNCRIDNLAEGIYLKPKWDRATAEGRAAYSKDYRALNADQLRDARLRSAFGVDLAEYQRMFGEQGGRCAICRAFETNTLRGKVRWLAIDHDHVTGAARALLCAACNQGIGQLGDDPTRLRAAADYLERHTLPANVVPLKAKDTA